MADGITPVYLTDLQNKRLARGWTRAEAAAVLGIHEQHLYRIEKGRSGVSFDLTLRCAKEFGPLKASSSWGDFLVVPDPKDRQTEDDPDRIPDDEELHDLNDTEHNLNVMKQAEDVVRAMQRLVASPLLLRSDSELSDALRVAKYKEIHELLWAARGRIREGQQLHPHLVEEGLLQALAERPGCQPEVSGIESAA